MLLGRPNKQRCLCLLQNGTLAQVYQAYAQMSAGCVCARASSPTTYGAAHKLDAVCEAGKHSPDSRNASGKLSTPAPMATLPRLNTDCHAVALPSSPTAMPPIASFRTEECYIYRAISCVLAHIVERILIIDQLLDGR